MPLHALNNFELQRYYKNEPKFNGFYSKNNLPQIKDKTYAINVDDYKSNELTGLLFMWLM